MLYRGLEVLDGEIVQRISDEGNEVAVVGATAKSGRLAGRSIVGAGQDVLRKVKQVESCVVSISLVPLYIVKTSIRTYLSSLPSLFPGSNHSQSPSKLKLLSHFFSTLIPPHSSTPEPKLQIRSKTAASATSLLLAAAHFTHQHSFYITLHPRRRPPLVLHQIRALEVAPGQQRHFLAV